MCRDVLPAAVKVVPDLAYHVDAEIPLLLPVVMHVEERIVGSLPLSQCLDDGYELGAETAEYPLHFGRFHTRLELIEERVVNAIVIPECFGFLNVQLDDL